MARRITIIVDDFTLKKLRKKQARLIRESSKSVSLSHVVNEALRRGIK